jgi:serine/threonine protein kinase
MVLEYLQGAPLSQLLQDGRKLPPAQAIELIVPVVRALTVAHAHNIVHRDLKPDNIFVTDSGTVKVLDFGIAKLLHQEDDDGAAFVRTAAALYLIRTAEQRATAQAAPCSIARPATMTARSRSAAMAIPTTCSRSRTMARIISRTATPA